MFNNIFLPQYWKTVILEVLKQVNRLKVAGKGILLIVQIVKMKASPHFDQNIKYTSLTLSVEYLDRVSIDWLWKHITIHFS